MDVSPNTLEQYPIGGLEVEMETSPSVFSPTSTSQLLASVVQIAPGAEVLDLGCGVGVLAIFAALKGAGSVYAVDIMEEACELARVNAERNNVGDRVRVLRGDLFEPVGTQTFDVIIDDVSGMADEVARLSPWFPPPIPTGGSDGTEHVVRMLEGVAGHLREGGFLYFPVLSLSNTDRILRAARGVFGERLEQIAAVDFPFCAEFRGHEGRLNALREQRLIDFTTRRSRHFWGLRVYRAWLG